MTNAFLYDLLSSIAERGRSVLKLRRWPKDSDSRADSLIDMCGALLTGRGEASGVVLASEILGRYRALDQADKAAVLRALADEFGPDRDRVSDAVAKWASNGDKTAMSELHYASEPRRQELFRRLNRSPGGTAALVALREEMLEFMREDPDLSVIDRDFIHLFGSWFNRGFLVLRRIDWSSPAAVLEKIIRYEAVHQIRDWDDLRRRIDPPDRRCYAFFHPALADEPLIFVEVAFTEAAPEAIAPLLSAKRPQIAKEKARVATFYSISNCQRGLSGVHFGNFLLKQVVEEIRRDLPRIETFVTLSPAPGLRIWAEGCDDSNVEALTKAARDEAADEEWATDPNRAGRLRKAVEPLAAYYLLKARRSDGRVIDPVARFHLGNGARVERVNWMADASPRALAESWGVMVNYLYDLNEIERYHEAFANQDLVAASSSVKKMLPSARSRAGPAEPQSSP